MESACEIQINNRINFTSGTACYHSGAPHRSKWNGCTAYAEQLSRFTVTCKLIYANSMVAEEIALENKEKVSKAVIESNKNRPNSNCVQMDACEKSTRDRSTNTREQVAKMSGVGTGTVARYTSGNLYMNLY